MIFVKLSNTKGLFLGIILVIIIVVVVTGGTYAFFTSSALNDSIVGATYSSDFGIEVYEIKKATSLIPVNDADIEKAINKTSDKCVDNDGKELCSLYKIDLINNGTAIDLQGFIRTSNSTYTTENLKYQVYSSNFSSLTDVMTITHNSGDTVYFKKAEQSYEINLADGTVTPTTMSYYIVFWISEINEPQDDQGKTYDCKIGFESIGGDKLTSTFSVSA